MNMENNMNNGANMQAPVSPFIPKIYLYMQNYGTVTGDALKNWLDQTFSDQISSASYTTYSAPSYRRNKEEVRAALETAYNGQWRLTLLEITSIVRTQDREIIKCKYVNNVPSASNPGQRINLYFILEAVFDLNTGLWVQSQHNQYVPEPVNTQQMAAQRAANQGSNGFMDCLRSCCRWYGRQVSNNLTANTKKLNEIYLMKEQMDAESLARAQATVERRYVTNPSGIRVLQERNYGGTWHNVM